MDMIKLNPVIRTVSLIEKVGREEERRAYDCRMIYLCSGDLVYAADGGKKSHLSPGQLLYLPAGIPYRLSAKYLRAVVIAFDLTDGTPDPVDGIRPDLPENFDESRLHFPTDAAPFDRLILAQDMESERDGFLRMENIFTSGEGNFRARISAHLKLVLLKLAELSDENALPARMVENLDGYIRENAHEEISNTELGAIFGYHPFYISKMLKEKKGITLHQYVISYRMKAAKNLLRYTARTVNEISDATGFSDPSYFTKSFKAQVGMTPKEYRAQFEDELI